jgi:hypothetical protein
MVWKIIRITYNKLIIYVSQRLFINLVVHRHVRIVFLHVFIRVNWKLLLVDLTKIQYARDGEGADL